MTKNLLFLLLFTLIHFSASAQSARKISGTVTDSTGNKISPASLKLVSATDTLTARSNEAGEFVFEKVNINFSHHGYQA